MLNLLIGEFFFEYLLFENFEKSLLASKQIIKPMIKIDKIKIYWWLKLIKIKSDNKIIDVIVLFNKWNKQITYLTN